MGIFRASTIFLAIIALSPIAVYAQVSDDSSGQTAIKIEQADSSGLDKLAGFLKNGMPTFAYFYYSVACSCTAAQCSLAHEAIDKTDELNDENPDLNFVSIDAYYEEAAESLYQCQVVPLVVGYDGTGKEIERAEWDIDIKAINKILEKIKH
jgi:hypothetical protein